MSHVRSEYYLVSMGQVLYVTRQFRILSCEHGPSFICHMSVRNIILWAWAKFYMSHVSSEYYLASMGQILNVTCQFRILSCEQRPSFICHMSVQNIILLAWAKFYMSHVSSEYYLVSMGQVFMSHVSSEYYLASMGQVLYVTCQFRILSCEHGPSFICHMSVQNIILRAWAKFYMSHVSSEYYLASMGQVLYVTCQFRILSCEHGPSFICHMSVQNIILRAWAKFYMSHVSSEYYLVSMGQVLYVTCQVGILSCEHGPNFKCYMSVQNIILWAWAKFICHMSVQNII